MYSRRWYLSVRPAKGTSCIMGGIYGERHLTSGLPSNIRTAHHHQPLLQQLWTLPVPRKTHPPHDQQRLPGQTPPRLRTRPQRPRLALRQRPLLRHPRRTGKRQSRRSLQPRRPQRESQYRNRKDHPDRTRKTPKPDHLRDRPQRPRPALRH